MICLYAPVLYPWVKPLQPHVLLTKVLQSAIPQMNAAFPPEWALSESGLNHVRIKKDCLFIYL